MPALRGGAQPCAFLPQLRGVPGNAYRDRSGAGQCCGNVRTVSPAGTVGLHGPVCRACTTNWRRPGPIRTDAPMHRCSSGGLSDARANRCPGARPDARPQQDRQPRCGPCGDTLAQVHPATASSAAMTTSARIRCGRQSLQPGSCALRTGARRRGARAARSRGSRSACSAYQQQLPRNVAVSSVNGTPRMSCHT